MVEGDGLQNQMRETKHVGSNPTTSAKRAKINCNDNKKETYEETLIGGHSVTGSFKKYPWRNWQRNRLLICGLRVRVSSGTPNRPL